MLLIAAAPSPLYAWNQSDMAGRIIVLILFVASIVAWTIIFDKFLFLRKLTRQVRTACGRFRNIATPRELAAHFRSTEGPAEKICKAALTCVAGILCVPLEQHLASMQLEKTSASLTAEDFARVKAVVEGAVDAEILAMEIRMGLLSSIVSVSPFLGLLGTVWGVMMAFTGMAARGKMDINAIAPGVSGALLTTVVGLLVAIPALLGYNLLVSRVKALAMDLDNYGDELVAVLGQNYRGS